MFNVQKYLWVIFLIIVIGYYAYTQWSNSISNYYNNLWNTQYEQNFLTWALQHYQTSLKYMPNEPVVLFNLWQVYYDLWEFESSLEYIQKSQKNYSQLIPGSDLLLKDVNDIEMMNYFQLGEYEKLEKLINDYLDLDQNNLIANFYKAKLLFYDAEYIWALGYIDRYLQMQPEDEEALYLKWDILYYHGDFWEAIAYFEQTKNYYSAWFSSLYARKFSDAAKYFELSVNQEVWESVDSHIENKNEQLYIALSYFFNDDFHTSAEKFKEIIKQDYSDNKYEVIPFYTLVQYNLGWLDKQWEDFIEAKLDTQKLIQNSQEIKELFLENNFEKYSDFLYQNYIYSGK